MHCTQNNLPPHQNEFTCIACGYNVIKSELNFEKCREKNSFFNRIKYARHEKTCNCINAYIIYESIDFNKVLENLSKLKNRKTKFILKLIEIF